MCAFCQGDGYLPFQFSALISSGLEEHTLSRVPAFSQAHFYAVVHSFLLLLHCSGLPFGNWIHHMNKIIELLQDKMPEMY